MEHSRYWTKCYLGDFAKGDRRRLERAASVFRSSSQRSSLKGFGGRLGSRNGQNQRRYDEDLDDYGPDKEVGIRIHGKHRVGDRKCHQDRPDSPGFCLRQRGQLPEDYRFRRKGDGGSQPEAAVEVPKTSHVPQKKELIGFHCLHSNRCSTRFDATKDAAHGVKNRVDERKDCCDTQENDGLFMDNSPFQPL